MGAGRPPLLPLVALVETLLPRSTLRLSHFIGHGFDVALRIVAGIAGLRMSNDGRARKSTISQEVIVVIALCWPEDDVDYSIVYFNIEVGFGRLLHGEAPHGLTAQNIRCAGWPALRRSCEIVGPFDLLELATSEPVTLSRMPRARYSITSLARASRVGGMVRRSALAVSRLTMKSNLVGCSAGMSAGLVPRRILST